MKPERILNLLTRRLIALFPSFSTAIFAADLVDLDTLTQDFILETKKIEIPNFPHAFNPSIVRWGDFILMSFRIIPDRRQSFTSWIGLIWLDQDFQPISQPQILNTRDSNSTVPSRAEDGRLVEIGERLFLVYSDNMDQKVSKGGFRLYCGELHFDGTQFALQNIERLSYFEGESQSKREKNWVPFYYDNRMLLAYSLFPHCIFEPIFGSETCQTFDLTKSEAVWDWGELRGGTPALMDNDEYFGFFHSSKTIASLQSEEKSILHYFVGAYTFSSKPPFTITRMSTQPIVGQGFYGKTNYKPYWKPVKAIFPCGFILDENYIWLAYGKDDHEVWIAKIDKIKLLESLRVCH